MKSKLVGYTHHIKPVPVFIYFDKGFDNKNRWIIDYDFRNKDVGKVEVENLKNAFLSFFQNETNYYKFLKMISKF
jgi:hypothetical protein